MRELVLDASVVLKWFRAEGERNIQPARALRREFEAGELVVYAPTLLALEIVNVAGRRWGWNEAQLLELADALTAVGFEFAEPELDRIARWTAHGLTAYDAAYVAVAEAAGFDLVTDDEHILQLAPEIATALSAHER